MRKLRDITVQEFVEEFVNVRQTTTDEIWERIIDVTVEHPVYHDYPDSFYASPPLGTVGEFFSPVCRDHGARVGRLTAVNRGSDRPYRCNDGLVFRSFVPGLPPDVDKGGYPK